MKNKMKLKEIRRLIHRTDNNGAKNAQVFNRLLYLRQMIEQTKIDQYNTAVAYLNDAVGNFNDFIRYRNKQFIPMRPDAEIQAMLDSASNPYSLAKMTAQSGSKIPVPISRARWVHCKNK